MSRVERQTRLMIESLHKQGIIDDARVRAAIDLIEERRALFQAYTVKKAKQFGLRPDDFEDLFYAVGIAYDRKGFRQSLEQMTRRRGAPKGPRKPKQVSHRK